MSIYLDNAATTPLDPEVFKAITPYLLEHYGNPSSHHEHGRLVKKAIEDARRTVADLLNASPLEIIFTSGGTEADNTILLSAIRTHQIKRVITTPFEHHAVLHTLQALEKNGQIQLNILKTDQKGNLNLNHFEALLSTSEPALVSVMHANNEIGNLNDIGQIGELCNRYGALFHSDTVQTMGHYRFDLQNIKPHFLAASAHKFHGPKGVGFIYCRQGVKLSKLIHGGSQERQLRAGTENITGIVGLAKALEVANRDMEHHQKYIQGLKDRMIFKLKQFNGDIQFNGNSAIANKSLYTVLSVSLPADLLSDDPLQYLDQHQISVSGGSACSTGSASHVLKAINCDTSRFTIRFSFSKFNRPEEIDFAAGKLSDLFDVVAA
jgi:cysteine desulfurase